MLVRICIHSLAAGTAVHLMFSLATKYSTINLSSTRFCGARLRFRRRHGGKILRFAETRPPDSFRARYRHNTGRAIYVYIAVSQQSSGFAPTLSMWLFNLGISLATYGTRWAADIQCEGRRPADTRHHAVVPSAHISSFGKTTKK